MFKCSEETARTARVPWLLPNLPHVHPFLLPIVRNFVFRNLARLVGQICADWVDGGSIIDDELQWCVDGQAAR